MKRLSFSDHARDGAGLVYVYPVVSRRAGGVSVGINLNPNNACNWRCVYCQVPNLIRGGGPTLDLDVLADELDGMLDEVVSGHFYNRYAVSERLRTIKDVAISGNGEPTSSAEFDRVIALVIAALRRTGLAEKIKLVLISNGSLAHRAKVRSGLSMMNAVNGEVWFKLDGITERHLRIINHAGMSPAQVKKNLGIVAALCPTWLQTCVFCLDGKVLLDEARAEYLAFLSSLRAEGVAIRGILLYGLARPSMQKEAARLSPVPEAWMRTFADEIGRLGFTVRVTL